MVNTVDGPIIRVAENESVFSSRINGGGKEKIEERCRRKKEERSEIGGRASIYTREVQRSWLPFFVTSSTLETQCIHVHTFTDIINIFIDNAQHKKVLHRL